MRIYHDIDDLDKTKQYETCHVARTNGYDSIQEQEDEHIWCGKHGTDEYIDVYKDGSWSCMNDNAIAATGASAFMLGIFVANKEVYSKTMAA